jgi:CheY-like chemotaxis protein
MPGLNGLEVCRQLRADPATRSIRVVILSAQGQEDDLAAGIEAGADAYLTKPISLIQLQDTVRSLLADRPAG